MKYNPDATPAQYANYDTNEVIEKGSAVRCKLIGLRNELGGLFAIGKMSGSFFGPV
jgi:DNA-directed RNA polymerase II subunit RPB7